MISYCTEKTTEYSLIPAFSDILDKLGENTPITYWKTREGNRTSRNVNNAGEVYLLAFFPRRPKVDPKKDYHIQGKINNYIFEFNSLAKKYSIAVFCGIPLARNIYELKNSEKTWFYIPENSPKEYEVIFNISNGIYRAIHDPLQIISPINTESVCKIIERRCKAIPWLEAIEIMAKLNRREKDTYTPWYIREWKYKPVYFLIKKSGSKIQNENRQAS